MEWSWRTVLILLGLLLVAGVMIDGFRRMRRARADALRFDLGKDNFSDDLYVNPELPQPYRVVDYEPKMDIKESYFSGINHNEEQYSEPVFEDQTSDIEYLQSFEDTEDDYYAEPVAKVESNTPTEADSSAYVKPAPLATRPVNLDEDFPVLLDVEELGIEELIHPPVQIAGSELDFHEVGADPFAELAMNEVVEAPNAEVSLKSLKQSFVEKDEDKALYTNEALAVDKSVNAESVEAEGVEAEGVEAEGVEAEGVEAEGVESNLEAQKKEEQTKDSRKDDSKDKETETAENRDAYADISTAKNKPAAKLAPLLYASADAEKLSERAEAQMALVIHCISRDELGFSGEDMVNLFNQCDVRFGEREIFHRFEQAEGKGSIQFSIVNSFEPRHFAPETILDQHFRGLSLFMKLPGAKNPSAAYEAMVAIAQLLAKHFNADLFDGERSALTQQTIEHERQQIVDFEYRQKVAAKKQALS